VRRRTGMAFARHYLKLRNRHTEKLLERMQAARQRDAFIQMEAALWRSFGDPSSSVAGRVHEVHCPTLLVWGRQDPVLRAAVEGVRARKLMPHAEWAAMDCGHVPFVEDPSGFLSVIRDFLGRCAPPERRAFGRADETGARP
jgi:pimeloyl-ACP methyl ester carboxylesterase